VKGRTIFNSRTPVPLVQRLALVGFSLGFICLSWMVEKGINSPNILFAEIIKVTMWLIIGAWSIIALIALLGLPPFQRKRRE
jgi:hypothetical protein